MHSETKCFVQKFFSVLIVFALMLALMTAGCGKTAKQKIVGKWSPSASNGAEIYNFTENGELITNIPSIPERKEKYRFIDDETLEIESTGGEKIPVKISFTDNDNTMNADVGGNKRIYKRQ